MSNSSPGQKTVSESPIFQRKIRSLDGLRAISIAMVIFGHISKYLSPSIQNQQWLGIFGNATLGVSIFFVISGYLITRLLFQEKSRTGEISLKNFYVRRILRIFPIFYLYILLIVFIKLFIFPNIVNNYVEIGFAALYLWNYKHLFYPSGDVGLYFGHYWSLSMEEQFYLIWPALFIKIKQNTLIKVVISLLLLMPLVRIATYFFMPGSRGQIHMMIQTGGDTILIGCLAALIEANNKYHERFRKIVTNNKLGIFSAIFIFIISWLLNKRFGGVYTMSIGQSIENVFVLFFVLWCVYKENSFSKLLNTTVFRQIGVISYSLYIWHVIILRNPNNMITNNSLLKIVLILIAGFGSYYLIEKPILKLKNKFK